MNPSIFEIQQRVLDKLNKPKINIAIIGSEKYDDKVKIKDFIYDLSLTKKDDIIILSGGRLNGADKFVRNYAVKFGLEYIEYNPAYTQSNIYSIHQGYGYDKPYSPKWAYGRNSAMIKACDKLIIFWPENKNINNEFNAIIKQAEKLNKKIIYIR